MNAKERKKTLAQLERLSDQQLVALATQKELMPYQLVVGQTRDALIEGLVMIEDVLVPVEA